MKATEWAGLAVVMNYCLYLFFCSTTFYFSFTQLYRTVSFAAMVGIGVLRAAVMLAVGIRTGAPAERKGLLIRYGCILLGILPCALVAGRFQYTAFAYLPFAMLCLAGTEVRRVLKCFTVCIGAALAGTVLCALGGSVKHLVYEDKGGIRASYGVAYPTDFASYLLYLLLFAWALQKKHSRGQTVVFAALALGLTWFLREYLRTDTTIICGLILTAVILYEGLDHFLLSGKNRLRGLTKTVDFLTIGIFPLLGIVFFGITVLYGQGNGFAVRMNELLTNRFSMAWMSIEKYGIRALGAMTPQNGFGHRLVHTETYEFLDSTYGLMMIRYGWVLALLLTALWVWMIWRALKNDHKRLALAMAVIAVHSFSEHHFPELNYNILLATPLCVLPLTGKAEKTEEIAKDNRAVIAKVLSAAAVLGVLCGTLLLLPRGLSWFRAVVDWKGWSGGGKNSAKALLLCLGGVGGLAAVCALLVTAVRKAIRDRKVPWTQLCWLVTIACVGAVGIRWTNDKIQVWTSRYEARINADAAAIQTVFAGASQPVYGDQMEEAYKRRFSGFSDRIFTPEEMARGKKGTIFVNKDTELQQLQNEGAKYCRISEYTGLYTFDEAAAETLSRAGYQVRDYYDVVREVDISVLASLNDVETLEDGSLQLCGLEHSLLHGPFIDQYEGNYEAVFQLEMDPMYLEDKNREVGYLRVASYYGKYHLGETPLLAKDFGKDGIATVTVPYWLPDQPGVEYWVYSWDVPLTVRRITWQRTGVTK